MSAILVTASIYSFTTIAKVKHSAIKVIDSRAKWMSICTI